MKKTKQKIALDEKEYFVSLKSNEIKNLDTLTIVICVENSAFWGNQFKALIDEINQICQSESSKLKKVKIVDTSYLNRHYDKKYEASVSEWRVQHQTLIETLVVDHEYVGWDSYLEHEHYQAYMQEIQKDYDTNRDNFKNLCDNFSKLYAHKNGLEAAKAYFLEEAAAFRLKDGVILYPGKLKDPFEWIMKHYSDVKITILPYSVKPQKNTVQNTSQKAPKSPAKSDQIYGSGFAGSYQPSFFAMTLASFADKKIGQDPEKQFIFMDKFIKLCTELSDSSSDDEDEKIISTSKGKNVALLNSM